MMELKVCALVVTLISSVISNPYGYGVKGGAGASAKAVAGASAGTFGGGASIPVPFGNGYSGSFTKSSSSSASSSSASSSSSSSSFTYSGYVPGGIAGLGSTGNIGCTSGLCQNSGAKDISGNLDVIGVSAGGAQGYNTANAATAGSAANCQGPTCISNSEKCLSGNCATNPQIETQPTGNDANKKCASGLCDDSLDDIHVIGQTSNTAYGSKDQSASDHKASDYSANSNCHGYSCGTHTTFDSQPDSAHQATNLPGKHVPATSHYEASNGYKSPSIHLETPKEESICESGDCNTDYSRPSYDNSLSSYNVPIHGTYDNKQKPQCQDGKCGNSQKGSYSNVGNSISTNYLNSQIPQSTKGTYYPSLPSCSGPNCGSVPSGYVGVKPTSPSNDMYDQFPIPSSNTGSTKCNSPSCNPHTVGPTALNVQPGYTNYAMPINTISTPNQNVPVYTGGFGAPGGVLSVNPSYINPSITLPKEPTIGSPVTACDSPNCLGQAPLLPTNEQATISGNKPDQDSKPPINSGGFGAPAGLLKPDDYTVPASSISKPIQPVSTIHSTPSSHTTGCKTGNCFGNSNIAGTTSTTATQTGSYNNDKANESGNIYTGGFGGQAGTLKPNEFDVKITTKPEQYTTPSYNSQPTVPATTDCETLNCIGNATLPGAVTGSSTQSVTTGVANDVNKLNVVFDSPSEVPLYTGGFGGPAGFLKPNEYNLPRKTPGTYSSHPVMSQNNKPTNVNSGGCSTPNCSIPSVVTNTVTNTQSSFAVTKPITLPQLGYTSHYGRPVGVTYPSPIAVAPITTLVTSTQSPSISCGNSNCDSLPTVSNSDKPSTTASSDSTNCNIPSCNPTASNVQHGQANYTLPIDKVSTPTQGSTTVHKKPTYEIAPTGCNTLNCYNQASLPSTLEPPRFSGTQPNEDTKLPIYSGGFGAPTGLLKPVDYNIPPSKISKPIQAPIYTPSSVTGCKTGKCFGTSNIAGTTSTTATQSGSYGNHKENENGNTYTGGFGGPTGTLKPNEFDVKITTKPEQYTTPSYNSQPTMPATADCKTPNCIGTAAVAGAVIGSSAKFGANGVPNVDIDSTSDLPVSTNGYGGPAGLLKPNEYALPRDTLGLNPIFPMKSQNKIPTNTNSADCFTPDCSHTVETTLVTSTQSPLTSCSGSNCDSVLSGFSSDKPSATANCNSPNCNPTGSNMQYKQNNDIAPVNKLSTHMQPSKTLQQGPIYGSAPTGCSSPNCFRPVSLSRILEPPTFSANKPNEAVELPIYSGSFDASTGLLKTNKYDASGPGTSKPIQSVTPTQNIQLPVKTGCKTGHCFESSKNAGTTSTSTTQLDSYGSHKESEDEDIYTDSFSAPTGQLNSNKSAGCKLPHCNSDTATTGAVSESIAQAGLNSVTKPSIVLDSDTDLPPYTGGFGAPAGLLKPNEFEAPHNAPNQYPKHPEKAPNKTPTTSGVVTNIVTNTQSPFAVTKPIILPQYYPSNYGRPVGVTYPSPLAVSPITLSTALPLLPTSTYNSNCKTADCDTYPASELSADDVVSSGVINLQEASKVSKTQHSGFNEPTISIKPSAQSNKQPSTVSSSTNCQSSDCSNLSSTITGSNSQVGSHAGPKQNLPAYTSGFGAPPGLLNPYDVSIPAGSLKPNEHTKPAAVAASPGCTSSYCNPKPTLSSSSSHNLATSLSSSHASASSSASASAVAYTGGFGGPPGILKPYDNDKTYVGKNYGKSQTNSPPDSKPETYSTGSLLNAGSTSQTGGQTNFDTLAGSSAGTYSGSAAGSNFSPYGYSQHRLHPAGNGDKTAGPCGGGCGGYQDSLTGSGNSAAAVSKSIASSGSSGFGGSFAGSSSSAHSSAGYYTKGGYGKR